MNPTQAVSDTKSKLAATTEHLRDELKKIRTGRAHSAMLDGVSVEVYGQAMPLKAAASIAAPEAQLLQVTPFDPGNLNAISDAIRNSQMGFNPADDGRVIRIQIPPLTEETRQQMVKVLGQKVEETYISARQIRQVVFKQAETAEKDRQIGRDELSRLEKQVDELLAAQKAEIEAMARAKETEITTL